jgi:tripartite-type tricarboxylate transporter receptor subunit TctC
MFSTLKRLFLIAAMALAAVGAHAQSYPTHSVRLVVPYPPGGSMDIVTRMLGKYLTESLGQSFVVENRSGASGLVGTAYVAKSEPDGYTLVMGAPTLVSGPYLNASMPFDPFKDLVPIQPNVLLLHPSVKANTVTELIDYAKANPGTLSFGSYGIGGSQHIATELFMMMSGTKMIHVPYTRTSALTDLVGGQINLMIDAVPTSLQYVKAGALKALAVTTAKRSPMMPDTPTMSEAGLTGYDFYGFNVLVAPTGTPKPIIDKLNVTINKWLTDPGVRKQLSDLGLEIVGGSPADAERILKEQDKLYARIVKEAHILPQN